MGGLIGSMICFLGVSGDGQPGWDVYRHEGYPAHHAAALLIAAVVGFASSFIPSYHAAKVNIVDGLRHIG